MRRHWLVRRTSMDRLSFSFQWTVQADGTFLPLDVSHLRMCGLPPSPVKHLPQIQHLFPGTCIHAAHFPGRICFRQHFKAFWHLSLGLLPQSFSCAGCHPSGLRPLMVWSWPFLRKIVPKRPKKAGLLSPALSCIIFLFVIFLCTFLHTICICKLPCEDPSAQTPAPAPVQWM